LFSKRRWNLANYLASGREQPLLSINIFYTLQASTGGKLLADRLTTLNTTTGGFFRIKDCLNASTSTGR
jgi:hypothetical protein